MKYRVISDLTDDEFKYIIKTTCNPDKIYDIRRSYNSLAKYCTISCVIERKALGLDIIWSDIIRLQDPYTHKICLSGTFEQHGSEYVCDWIRGYCFSRGIFPLYMLKSSCLSSNLIDDLEERFHVKDFPHSNEILKSEGGIRYESSHVQGTE